ncbi:MAG: GNAT family N-acetyltransferase [Candidatus Geothermarchaeales archaeon]
MASADRVNITEIRADELGQSQWEAIAGFLSKLYREFDPHPPTISAELLRNYWSTDSPRFSVTRWLAWESENPVGIVSYTTSNTEANQHLADVWFLGVRKDRRRQGIGSRLLGYVTEKAQTDQRNLLAFSTSVLIPAGEALVKRLGARHVYTHVQRRLELEDVDKDQLRRWLEQSPRRAGNIQLEFWDGSFPEDDKEQVADLLNSIQNDMPRMNATMEDAEYTPEQVWGHRQRDIEAGSSYWTYVARDSATGKLVGFTEVSWWPGTVREEGHVFQGDTGVLREHRRRGIGRWLKVAMLDRVLRELSEGKFMTTGSAEVNEAMHGLNRSLGFKVENTYSGWEIDLTSLKDYLNELPGSSPS